MKKKSTISVLSALALTLMSLPSLAQQGGGCVASFEFETTAIDQQNELGMCGAHVDWLAPVVTAECSNYVVETTHEPGDFLETGVHIITYQARKDGGEIIGMGTFTVEVYDSELPVADYEGLEDIYLECGIDQFDMNTIPKPTATDQCSGVIEATGVATFLEEQDGYLIDWLMEDEEGNILDDSQFVGFRDETPPLPTLEVLPEIISEDPVMSLANPGVTDACSDEVEITNDATFPIEEEGTTVVTWTYTDEVGNSTTQAQNVTIGITNSIGNGASYEVYYNIYPNPSNGAINIRSTHISTLNIYNLIGGRVHTQNLSSGVNTIGLDELNAGIYIVKLEVENNTFTEKITIR